MFLTRQSPFCQRNSFKKPFNTISWNFVVDEDFLYRSSCSHEILILFFFFLELCPFWTEVELKYAICYNLCETSFQAEMFLLTFYTINIT